MKSFSEDTNSLQSIQQTGESNYTSILKELHRLRNQRFASYEKLFQSYLEMGARILGLPHGIVSHIQQNIYTIKAIHTTDLDIKPGAELELGQTYCHKVFSQKVTVAQANIPDDPDIISHPAYASMPLGAYISTPIYVDDDLYGTFNFFSLEPRAKSFDNSEIELIELMSESIGSYLRLWELEQHKQHVQQELRAESHTLSGLIEVMPNALLVLDHQKNIRRVNRKAAAIFRTSEESLLNLPIQNLLKNPEELKQWEQNLTQSRRAFGATRQDQESTADIKSDSSQDSATLAFRRFDNTHFSGETSSNTVQLEEGSPPVHVIIIRDISKQLEYETELKQARDRAEAASHARTQFMANTSHELRTPLQAIIGMTELVLESDLNTEQRDYLNRLHLAGINLLQIINDVLDISRIEANQLKLEKKDFNLEEIFTQVKTIFDKKIQQKDLSLSYKLQGLPDFVQGDPLRLQQILINLVGNSIKFTEKGGITVGATYDRKHQMLFLKVHDTGVGIPPESLEQLFEKFAQADASVTRKFGGTGLGLAIVQQLVNLMDGSIKVSSTPGAETTFEVECFLPISQYQSDQNEKQIQDDWTPDRQIKILIVDDNEDNRLLMKRFLNLDKIEVTEAESGHKALQLFRTVRFDLIFMDIQMPNMDGHECTEQIRLLERTLRIRPCTIIACTAHALQDSIQRSMRAGCDGQLSKPFRKQDILNIIKEHIK